MPQRVSKGPYQIAEIDIHLLNEVFRLIQLEIDSLRGLQGSGEIEIGPHSHSSAGSSTSTTPGTGGLISHDDLDDVSANDHHNKSHAHDGDDGSGTVAFEDLTSIPPEVHPQVEGQLSEKLSDKVMVGSGMTLTELGDGSGDAILLEASGEANTASNVGTGSQVFKQKTGVDLEFRTLTAGSNITLTQNTNDIEIAAIASGSSNTDQALEEAKLSTPIADEVFGSEGMLVGEYLEGDAINLDVGTTLQLAQAQQSETSWEKLIAGLAEHGLAIDSTNRPHLQGQNRFRYLNSMVQATLSVAQTIANSTFTLMAWTAESFDTDNLHDTSTNNSRLTAAFAGKYLICGVVSWDADADGVRVLQVEKNANGVANTDVIGLVDQTPAGAIQTGQSISFPETLAAGDYVEMFVFHTAGNNLDVNATAQKSSFGMIYLGE
jgi:hypothetical protein